MAKHYKMKKQKNGVILYSNPYGTEEVKTLKEFSYTFISDEEATKELNIELKKLNNGKLINILLITDIKRLAVLYTKKIDRELSFVKLIKHLKYNQKLEKAILNGEILELLEQIEKNITKYCKTKRKRKTSLQLLDENIGFLEASL